MSEKLLCIVTPADRTYYRVSELAKEFLDKDGNVVHATGTLPEGEFTEYSASTAAVKHFQKGKLNGKVQIINLADNTVTFSEEYLNGKLVRVAEETLPKKKEEEERVPLYAGTIVKTNQGTRSFYINGQQVAEQNLSKDGVLELLGTIPDGEVKEFNDKRQLVSEAHYQANKLHGLFVHYDERGKSARAKIINRVCCTAPRNIITLAKGRYFAPRVIIRIIYCKVLLSSKKWTPISSVKRPTLSAAYAMGNVAITTPTGKKNHRKILLTGYCTGNVKFTIPTANFGLWKTTPTVNPTESESAIGPTAKNF